jgi:hypothetical protein
LQPNVQLIDSPVLNPRLRREGAGVDTQLLFELHETSAINGALVGFKSGNASILAAGCGGPKIEQQPPNHDD